MKQILQAILLFLFLAFAQAEDQPNQGWSKIEQSWLRIEQMPPGSCNYCYNLTVIYSKKEPAIKKIAENRWVIIFKP